MSLRDRIRTLEDQFEGISIALGFAVTLEEPERSRRLQLVIHALHTARQELRAVRDADRRRPKLGAVAPAGAGVSVGAVLTWLRDHKAATAAVGITAATAIAIGIAQLPDTGAPDGGQARPSAASPAPTLAPTHPEPESGGPGEKRPSSTHTREPVPPTEARTHPRTLTTSGARPGATPAPGQPGPSITGVMTPPADTPDEPDPSGPAPTETPTTPPPDTSSPPDPTDPPREGPGGLLCLDVELGWLVDLDLCVL